MTVSVLLALVAAFLFACGSAAQQSEAAQVEAGEPLMSELLHSPGGGSGSWVTSAATCSRRRRWPWAPCWWCSP
ncbi:hypothetical protein [Tsukamurella soli]|uniref:hypothetical protein n=1 Tax=Tsukamurella soli TaxID=644556 RepID=UPI003620B772